MPVPAGPTIPSFSAGPCEPWELADCRTWPESTLGIRAEAIMAATEVLWEKTYKRFGLCEYTLRPCAQDCAGVDALAWLYGSWLPTWGMTGGGYGWPYPALVGGLWLNLGCGTCQNTCSCTEIHQVALPYPVSEILEVKVDGAVLDPASYRVDDWRYLVRLDGEVWPRCFPAGTLVTTKHGQVPIEEVEVGDWVLTHRGRWRSVTGSQMTGIRETVTTKAHGSLTSTPDHPVWSRGMHRVGNKRKFAEPEWSPASTLTSRYVATPHTVPDAVPVVPEGHVDNDAFWNLVGFWLGDGWTNEQGRVRMAVKKQRKRDYLDAIIPDWHCTLEAEGTKVRYGCTDHPLAEYLRREFGAYAAGKRIPTWMIGAPERVRRAFLDGYVNSDGTLCKQGEVRVVTMSKPVAIALKLLVNSLGMTAATYQHKTNRSWHVTWRPGPRIAPWSISDDRAHWVKATSVTENPLAVPVYDLTVDEDESFVADGYIVHNCNDLNLADTEDGTWSVTAVYGEDVPELGKFAANDLALQIALACVGDGSCILPSPTVKRIQRQGVSKEFYGADLSKGLTGIYSVDLFISTYAPTRSGVATILDLDRAPARRVGT